MKRKDLKENVKNIVMCSLKKEKSVEQNTNIDKFVKRISETELLYKELQSKRDKQAIYMYQSLNIINLYDFMKIYLEEQEIGYFEKSKKILLNERYKIQYNGIKFILFLSYEFTSFEIKSQDFSIEPYVFVADKLSVDLINEDDIIWNKEYNFYISEDEYIKKINKLDVEVRPCLNTRACEIFVFERGNKISSSVSYKFEEIFKYILDILVDQKSINKDRYLKYTFREKGIYLEDVEVDSNFVYNNLIIGKLKRKDTLYKYEATFVIEGSNRYVKLCIYLTQDEYKNINELQKYISPEKILSKVDKNSSVYFEDELRIFRINYCSGENKANMYINLKKSNIYTKKYIQNVLTYLLNIEPILVDITNKKLPFSKVILYKNILKINKGDEDLKKLNIYDIEYEDIIYIKNRLYFFKKYILTINNLVYKVELLSKLKQGLLNYCDSEINLPILLSEEVEIRYQKIDNVNLKLDNLIYNCHLYNDLKFDNHYKITLLVNLNKIMSNISREYKRYFKNINIHTIGNVNALKSRIDRSLKFNKNINICDLISNDSKEFIINLGNRIILVPSDYYEEIDGEKVNLFADDFLIGSKIVKNSVTLDLRISEEKNLISQGFLSIDVNEKDIYYSNSLYYIFSDINGKEITVKELNINDELTKIYIETICKAYAD